MDKEDDDDEDDKKEVSIFTNITSLYINMIA